VKIFIQSDGKALGPCTVEQIQSLLAGGWISPGDLAKYENETDWRAISSFPEFLAKDPIASANLEKPTVAAPVAAPKREPAPAAKPLKDKAVATQPPKLPFWKKMRFAIKLPGLSMPRIPWRRIPLKGLFFALGAAAIVAAIVYLGLVTYSSLSRRYQAYQEKRAVVVKNRATNAPVTPVKTPLVEAVAGPALAASNEVAVEAVASVLPAIMLDTNNIEATSMPEEQSQTPAKKRYIAHSMDPQATPFGGYDVSLIQAIQKHWLEILDQQDIVKGRSGKVIVEFRLSAEGKVTNLRVVESSADEMLAYLCRKAIMEQSPWLPWPEELRPLIKNNYREMRFTFYY
jgi:TonB family protein